jgi:hypothetical protein
MEKPSRAPSIGGRSRSGEAVTGAGWGRTFSFADAAVACGDAGHPGAPVGGAACADTRVRHSCVRRDSAPDARRRSSVLHRSMGEAWFHSMVLRDETQFMPPQSRLRWTCAGTSRHSSSSPRPCAPSCWRAPRRRACAALRSSSARSQSVICRLPGLMATLITEVAPETSKTRNRSLPARLIPRYLTAPVYHNFPGVAAARFHDSTCWFIVPYHQLPSG